MAAGGPVETQNGGKLQSTEQYHTSIPTEEPLPEEQDHRNLDANDAAEEEERVVTSISSKFFVAMIVTFLITLTVLSRKPWLTLLFAILAILPALPIARFLLRNFRDGAVSRTFLLSQFVLGAVPLIVIVVMMEIVFSGLIGLAVFGSQAEQVQSMLDSVDDSTTSGDKDRLELFITAMAKVVPLWKILLYFVLVAFITAGAVEEVGKWIIGRRYRLIEREDPQGRKKIGCRGVIMSACAASLGFAATENMSYVLGVSQGSKVSFGLIIIVLLRGLLAYPVHIGTQFYVAITAAQHHVFKDPSSIGLALTIAVLFHGTFDAVAFICVVLIGLNKIPQWVGFLVPVFDIILIGLLMLLCRGRYKGLLERERLVLLSNPVQSVV